MRETVKNKLNLVKLKYPELIKNGLIHIATKETDYPHYHLITLIPHHGVVVYPEPSFNLDGGKTERYSITTWLRRNGFKFTTRNAQDVGAYVYKEI